MSIKDEICGPSGYLKQVRDHCLPNSQEMANLAFDHYQEEIGIQITAQYVRDNADEILKGLFIAETDLFNHRNGMVLSSVIPYYYRELYRRADDRYPETSENMERLISLYEACRRDECEIDYFVSEISETVGPMIDVISFSQKQAAKCRVGNTLQNHLRKLFEICSIPNEPQQQRSDGGTIMDFVIPSLEAYTIMPDQVINIECQTTLKDRFRLTTGKSTDARIKRYLATATGCGIVTAKDLKDLTVGKVREIVVDNNVTLVVFEDVKRNIIARIEEAHQKAIVAGNDVEIREYEQLLRLCTNKVISYKELINRDIRSIMVYWNE